jgi:hypothetical protein
MQAALAFELSLGCGMPPAWQQLHEQTSFALKQTVTELRFKLKARARLTLAVARFIE